jgi:hypothetical protein
MVLIYPHIYVYDACNLHILGLICHAIEVINVYKWLR